MVQLTSKIIGLATTVFIFSSDFAAALSPGSYIIQNVQFSKRVFTGQGKGVALPQQGYPITALNQGPNDLPVLSNSIFTIDSTMTTIFNEEAQQFAVVDASDGGSAGVGLILCNTTVPVAPFNPIGNSAWSFQQGSQGMMITLSGGRQLAWSMEAVGFGTQITLQTLNPSDLKQQWLFVAHALV